LSWVFARMIPPTGEGAPHLVVNHNIAVSTWRLLAELRTDPRQWWGGMVSSWFWLVGSVALTLIQPLVKDTLGGAEEVEPPYIAVFAIGVALGSGLASWLCHGRIVLVPTLIGAIFLAVFTLDLGWAT